jgi:5-formyltetrahydrofolate cyclo-ligase
MDSSSSEKIKSILIQEYNYKIYKTIGSYFQFDKSYMIFIYWKTDKELELITDTVKQEIRKIILDYFSKCTYYPNKIENVTIYFDSDENVQKNYDGNYFYATR